MSEQLNNPSIDERVAALENQCYLMYLQINGVTAELIEKGTLTKEELTAAMDRINQELYEVTMEMIEKEKATAVDEPTIQEEV